MRVWGRVPRLPSYPGPTWDMLTQTWDSNSSLWLSIPPNYVPPDYSWQEVDTDSNGYNDAVYVTALIQVLKLQTGESPFYAQYGIPAQQSVALQTFPDYSVYFIQQQYSQYFAALKITKVNQNNQYGVPEPVYAVSIVTQQGSIINLTVPIPQ